MIEASQNYIASATVAIMGLYFIVYVIYGKVNNRSLIGSYKPGAPGYNEFKKLVNNSAYLIMAITVTTIAVVYAVLQAQRVLRSNAPHSVLIVMPIGFIVLLVLLSYLIPYLFGKKR